MDINFISSSSEGNFSGFFFCCFLNNLTIVASYFTAFFFFPMSCPNKLSFIEVEDEFLLLLCLYLNALDFWVRCTYFVVHTRASNFHIILRLTNYVTGDPWKCAALLFRWHNFKNEIILFNMQWMSNDEDVDYVRAFKCKYLLMLHTHNLN